MMSNQTVTVEKTLQIFLTIILLVAFQEGIAAQRKRPKEPSYKYEPVVSELVGVLGTRVYPGPPNYESIKTGDRAERIWHVKLKTPITVLGDADPTSQNEKESSIKEMQLIIVSDKLEERLRKHMGATILFRGTLTHAITGHHHLPVLMEVTSFKVQK